MANQQTRRLLKLGLGTRMVKGAQDPNNTHSSYTVGIDRPLFHGVACPTHFGAVGNKHKHAWQGALNVGRR